MTGRFAYHDPGEQPTRLKQIIWAEVERLESLSSTPSEK